VGWFDAHSQTLKRLTKEYRSLGLSETEAKLAAQMEDAVRDVEQSSRSLFLAAKSIGMTDAAARALCHSGQMICT
jgi:hypothetical protein